MAAKIIWTVEAEDNLDLIIDFILLTWNEKVAKEFLQKLNKSITQISIYPESFPASEKYNQKRKCVITKQVTLFYTHQQNKIYIEALFDSRQSDEKLNLK